MDATRRRDAVFVAVGFELLLGCLGLGLGWLLGHPAWQPWSWRWFDAALGLAASLPLVAGFFFLVRWPLGPFARIKHVVEGFVGQFFGRCTTFDLAVVALAAGWGEELLFRGALQGALGRWLGPWLGLAAASLLFGLVHSITATYALAAAAIGAYLGWLLLATENLLVPVLVHAFYDFVALAWLHRRRADPARELPAED